MTSLRTVASLFDKEPAQWGLRGDPHLWREMRTHFAQTPLPDSADELVTLLESTFKSLTGHPITESQAFFVEHFDHGGMSGGHIDPNFWLEKAIPLLRARYAEA